MLLQSPEECYHINRQIATNEKYKSKDRIQASETMCLAHTYLQIVNEGTDVSTIPKSQIKPNITFCYV